MSYHHGWLYLGGNNAPYIELINHARTAAYLQNPELSLDGVSVTNVLDFGGCSVYPYEPPCSDEQNGYFESSGTAGNFLSVPDAASLEISGDITIIMEVALNDWTPAAGNRGLMSKWTTSGNQRSWSFEVTLAGELQFLYSTAGTATSGTLTSTANLGSLANTTKRFVAVTVDASVSGGNGQARFWWSLDGANWNELGTAVSAGGVISMFNSTALLRVGSVDATSQTTAGKIHYVSIRSGIGANNTIGGTERFRFDGDNDLVNETDLIIQLPYGFTGTRVTGVSGGTFLSQIEDTTEWDAMSFSTPQLDEAPWYSPSYPESADALGFYIEEWTGLDNSHTRRAVTQRGSPGGGVAMGKLQAGGRVMKLNVILFARNEKAMEYLFRWLETALLSVCGSCALDSIITRRVCPAIEDIWDGVVELKEVGLSEGPIWESDIAERGRCMIRRLSFSLTAGDPCMYVLPGVDVTVTNHADVELLADPPTGSTPDRYPCRPACSESGYEEVASFEVDVLGAAAPIIEIFAPSPYSDATIPVHVVAFYDPAGTGPNCGLEILSEIWLRSMPGGTRAQWDILGRRFLYQDSSTGGMVPGEHLLRANTPGIPRYTAFPCGTIMIAVGYGSLCLEETDQGYVDSNGEGGFYLPGFEVAQGERLGCP